MCKREQTAIALCLDTKHNGTPHYDNQHNNTPHYDTQHTKKCDTYKYNTGHYDSIYCHTKCLYAQGFKYAHHAECLYVECHKAECHGTKTQNVPDKKVFHSVRLWP
jgi:hypothetical protein